ncbi:MAG: DEAD/DEAH box helicase [Acidimicrobiales bacterium]|nr:DEAD/DEAH box helicase [Acidimicrobiales bacterium]
MLRWTGQTDGVGAVSRTRETEKAITTTSPPPAILPRDFEDLVQAHLDGRATDDDVKTLEHFPTDWVRVLYRFLDQADRVIEDAKRSVPAPAKNSIVEDFDREAHRIDEVLTELLGPPKEEETLPPGQRPRQPKSQQPPVEPGETELQLSWEPGVLIAWAGGRDAPTETATQVRSRLEAAGGGSIPWEEHRSIKLLDGSKAPSLVAPLGSTLGWLVAQRASADGDDPETHQLGATVPWLGLTTAMAVRLTAQGRMVPKLRKVRKRDDKGRDVSTFQVRWEPALIDPDTIAELAAVRPGAAATAGNRQDGRAFTQSLLTDLVSTICGMAAERLEVPAPPPDPRSRTDVAETVLARLDGSLFDAPTRAGSELVRRLDQWSAPVTGTAKFALTIALDPPDEGDAWHCKVLGPGADDTLEPVEVAMVNASNTRAREMKEQLARVERLFPELSRPGGRRRGEVILSQDEAWQLMSETGDVLRSAGFNVQVPVLSKKKPTPTLRLTAEETEDSKVGAQQLANVSWSVVFGDVELTSTQIQELAREARPLVKSGNKWVEIDKADLREAAAALAERADQKQLTGADMLRQALGLEGSPLAGGISITGDGWAADLLRSAARISEDDVTTPEGFAGELRSYQAEAVAWLRFLDEAGLGGCLALDMGLGKTPTILAHVLETTGQGPTLVVAPPAVVGNWAAEARRFTGSLKVVVHHGQSRTSPRGVSTMAENADLVLTTYGTAVRDVEALSQVDWAKVVLDEAQAIKNPTSDTAQQLRRIEARTRIALTGTPIENGLGDLWSIIDYCNPGLVGERNQFVSQLSPSGTGADGSEGALRALNGILVFRRTKAEPAIAAELPDRIDELDHCSMTAEQIGLYQAVLDRLVVDTADQEGVAKKKGAVLAAITALKQICNHPEAYTETGQPLDGRSGKLTRLNEIVESVFDAGERVLIFTHFASWGEKLADHLTERYDLPIHCYHGGLARGARDKLVQDFQAGEGAGAMVLSLKAGGTGLNLTSANHVVLYDRWWNPAVEDQARDRVWRIGQDHTVIAHRLVCPGTVDERVEEVVAGKRQIADLVLPKSSSIGDLDAEQLQQALGIDQAQLLTDEGDET